MFEGIVRADAATTQLEARLLDMGIAIGAPLRLIAFAAGFASALFAVPTDPGAGGRPGWRPGRPAMRIIGRPRVRPSNTGETAPAT